MGFPLQLAILALGISLASFAKETRLVLVGGGHIPEEAVRQFTEWAGGEASRTLLITFGSTVPETYLTELRNRIKPYNAYPDAVVEGPRLPIHFDAQGNPVIEEVLTERQQKDLLGQIEQASGIFFSGGDQEVLMRVFKKYPAIEKAILKKHSEDGVVIGGTSAGTAITSLTMIVGDEKNPKNYRTTTGLPLLKEMVVDQHFFKRHRQERLKDVWEHSDAEIGLGIEEGSAVSIVTRDGERRIKVLGPQSRAQVLDKKQTPHKTEMHGGESRVFLTRSH